jgi:aryl-alcohol dehydrogenase-like predicted oxidoreductase
MDRRDFLKRTAAAGLAAAAVPPRSKAGEMDALPRRPLGKTGVEVTPLAFGGGSHFLGRIGGDEAEARRLIERAFELGIRYFDTAAGYTFRPHERLSETYYGRVLAPHRDQIFLATKSGERDRDGMLRSVEKSLELLRTDRLDLVQMHSLREREELDRLERPDGGLTALRELREQKVVRFIGATGHYNPEVLLEAVDRFDIDTLLVSLNAAQTSHPLSMAPGEPLAAFEEEVLPAAVAKGIGVNAMKVMGQGNLVGDAAGSAEELIRYVLSLPISTAVIAHTSLPILEQNVAAARSFHPMDEGEKAALRSRLSGVAPAWARFLHDHEDGAA